MYSPINNDADGSARNLAVNIGEVRLHAAESLPVVSFRLTYVGLFAVCALATLGGIKAAVAYSVSFTGDDYEKAARDKAELARQANTLCSELEKTEPMRREYPDEQIDKLFQDLKQRLTYVQCPCVEVRDVLAQFAAMQSAIGSQQARANVSVVDDELQAFGHAIALVPGWEKAGTALSEGKYELAAQELAKIDDPDMTDEAAELVQAKLCKVSKSAGKAGLGTLRQAAIDIADGMQGDEESLQRGTQTLARAAREQRYKKEIYSLLEAHAGRLGPAYVPVAGSPPQTVGAAPRTDAKDGAS